MTATRKVTHNIQDLAELGLAGIENDIEYLLFVDNEKLFPMSEYTKLQPIIEDLAKLVVVYADAAARKMQDNVIHSVANHLKSEVGNVVYRSRIPTVTTLTITDSRLEVEPETKVEPHNDW